MAKKKSYREAAHTAAKRAVRRNPKAFLIAAIAVLLIVAVAFCVLYFGFPDAWNGIAAKITGDDTNPNPGNSDDGNSSDTGTKPPVTTVIDASLQLPEGKLQTDDGSLSVHMLDVGQGDCLLILFPDNTEMIIDCANYNNSSAIMTETLAYIDRYITDGQIEYLMLTHCDSDHVYFMDEIIGKYKVSNIFMPNVLAKPDSKTWQDEIAKLDTKLLEPFTDPDTVDTVCYAEFFCAALTEPDCNIVLNVAPDENTSYVIGGEDEGYTFTFYFPTQEYYDTTKLNTGERKNAISPIGILEYNDFRIVFTGDSNELNEPSFVKRLPNNKLDCDILKVGHHGSETSSTDAFLDAITCEYAMISCNADGNDFNHPRQATLDRLIARNMSIYRTDNNGNIVFVLTDEIKVYVETRVTQETNRIGLNGTSKK